MPAEKRIRLDDQERRFPMSDAASQEDEPEAVAVIEARSFDLTLKNKKLVAEQSIFGEELRAAAWEIGEYPGEEGRVSRGGVGAEEPIGEVKDNAQKRFERR